jgi:tetratricopeptide (TPR) repeat protein
VYVDLVGLPEHEAEEVLLGALADTPTRPASAAFPGLAPEGEAQSPVTFPGGLASIWHVPRSRSRHFVGRASELDALDAKKRESALTISVLSGLGGVGKSHLAVEHAYRCGTSLRLVWWFESGGNRSLPSQYLDLADALGVVVEDPESPLAAFDAVVAWLARETSWLLIFDDADSPETIAALVPQVGGGQIVVTTRNPNWGALGEAFDLRPLEREQSTSLLTSRQVEGAQETLDELAAELGGLPLALVQAASYMEATQLDARGYLDLFRERRAEVLRRGEVLEYPDTVATTWELSYRRLAEIAPDALYVLHVLAYMGPAALPRDVVAADLLGEVFGGDALPLQDALGALRRYSLVELTSDSVWVHQLVQVMVRAWTREQREAHGALALAGLLGVLPEDAGDPAEWSVMTAIMPHVVVVGRYDWLPEGVRAGRVRLLGGGGDFLAARGDLYGAAWLFEEALQTHAPSPRQDPLTVTLLQRFGSALQELGELERAQTLLEQACSMSEAVTPAGDPLRTLALRALGALYRDQGRYQEAVNVCEAARQSDEAARGADHPDTIADVLSMGNALFGLAGQSLTGALGCYSRAIRHYEERHNQRMLASAMNDLGSVLRMRGETKGAVWHHERALSIDEEIFGPDHPAVARALNNLAGDFIARGVPDEAVDRMERALAVYEHAYGSNHRKVALALSNLAVALRSADRREEARVRLQAAERIIEGLPPDDPIVQNVRLNLALERRPEEESTPAGPNAE